MAITQHGSRVLPLDISDQTVDSLIQLSDKLEIPVQRLAKKALNRGILELQRKAFTDDPEVAPVATADSGIDSPADHGTDDDQESEIDPELIRVLSLSVEAFITEPPVYDREAELTALAAPIDWTA